MRERTLKKKAQGAAVDRHNTFYLQYGKRIFDVSGALAGIIIVSPVLAVCAIVIVLDSPGPIIFRQWRIGEHGKPFQILKLRTMVHGADQIGPKVTAQGDCRITRVGKLLRKTKLDEIPQLLNVLRGEMSFVGPRPEVPEYVATYTPDQMKVLEYKPGITDPASVVYSQEEKEFGPGDVERQYISMIMPRKIELSIQHLQRRTFLGDMGIIIQTLLRICSGRRDSKRGSTLPEGDV